MTSPGGEPAGTGLAPPPTAELGPAAARPANGVGRAALVFAIVALVSCWLVVGGLVGIVALVLGIIGWARGRRGDATNGRVALTAAVLGAVATVIAGLIVAGLSIFYLDHRDDLHTYQACKNDARTAQERSACVDRLRDALTGG